MRFSCLPGYFTAAALAAALAGAGSAQAQEAPAPSTVRPHLEGAGGLRLEQKGPQTDEDDEDSQWTQVCDAPCDRSVRVDGTYRVAGGPDIAPSGELHLRGRGDERVVVSVDRTTRARREAGKGILIGGVVGIGAGVTLFTGYALGSFAAGVSNTIGCETTSSASCHTSEPKAALWAGAFASTIGVAALVTGIILMTPTSAQQAPRVDDGTEGEDRWTAPPQVNGPASFVRPSFVAPRMTTTMPVLSATF